jgi:hypothetical protein
MLQRTFALALVTLLLVNVTWQQESFALSNSQLQATEIGLAQSFLKLLVVNNETTYAVVSGDTLNSIAESYYGSSSFTLLLMRANADTGFKSTTKNLRIGTKLRLPSVLLCPQFLGVDCVYNSYHQSLALPDITNNFWKNLNCDKEGRFIEVMTYPQYIPFIMSALLSQDLNPTLNFNIKVSNNAYSDLTNGTITFTTGFGQTPDAVIPVNSVYNYRAQRSDILQGIHGTLSYLIRNATTGVQEALNLTFHVYAGNGTIPNTFSLNDQVIGFSSDCDDVESAYLTSQNEGFRSIQIKNHTLAWAAITRSPNVQLNIVLEPIVAPVPLSLTPKLITSVGNSSLLIQEVTELKTGNKTKVYMSSIRDNTIWQGWRFVSLSDGWKHRNQFRILNAHSGNALEVNENRGTILPGTPDESNANQIWSVIPIGQGSNTVYQIKSKNGLCLHLAAGTAHRFPTNDAKPLDSNEIWLEKCDTANNYQKWTITDQTTIVFFF